MNQTSNWELVVPEMMNISPKLYELLTDFNLYVYFLVQGGRGSSKTQTIARLFLFIMGCRKVRIIIGRHSKVTVDTSVYAVMVDLITSNRLPVESFPSIGRMIHRLSGSTITFMGFREMGRGDKKGLECDLLWIDESEQITEAILGPLMPTLRKCKVFFTMNRYLMSDAVPAWFENRPKSLNLEINYLENPFCDQSTIDLANYELEHNPRGYRNTFLNEPLMDSDSCLFDQGLLEESTMLVDPDPTNGVVLESEPVRDWLNPHLGVNYGKREVGSQDRVMGIDFASQGDDLCAVAILDRVDMQKHRLAPIPVRDARTVDEAMGWVQRQIVEYQPKTIILDVGGPGNIVHNNLSQTNKFIHRFDGSSTRLIDIDAYVNLRAAAYYELKLWFERGWLILDKAEHRELIYELRHIRMKHRDSGKRLIESKSEMKKRIKRSPDRADAVMMSVWGAMHCREHTHDGPVKRSSIRRVSGRVDPSTYRDRIRVRRKSR